jgi:hypothetical protein
MGYAVRGGTETRLRCRFMGIFAGLLSTFRIVKTLLGTLGSRNSRTVAVCRLAKTVHSYYEVGRQLWALQPFLQCAGSSRLPPNSIVAHISLNLGPY